MIPVIITHSECNTILIIFLHRLLRLHRDILILDQRHCDHHNVAEHGQQRTTKMPPILVPYVRSARERPFRSPAAQQPEHATRHMAKVW